MVKELCGIYIKLKMLQVRQNDIWLRKLSGDSVFAHLRGKTGC